MAEFHASWDLLVTPTLPLPARTSHHGERRQEARVVASGQIDPPPDLENLKLQKILLPAPGHLLLTFSSTSPVQPTLSGSYTLTVVGIPAIPLPHPAPVSLTMPLSSVPTKPPVGLPPPTYIMRTGINYQLLTTANVAKFTVRITAPNGTYTEKSV